MVSVLYIKKNGGRYQCPSCLVSFFLEVVRMWWWVTLIFFGMREDQDGGKEKKCEGNKKKEFWREEKLPISIFSCPTSSAPFLSLPHSKSNPLNHHFVTHPILKTKNKKHDAQSIASRQPVLCSQLTQTRTQVQRLESCCCLF